MYKLKKYVFYVLVISLDFLTTYLPYLALRQQLTKKLFKANLSTVLISWAHCPLGKSTNKKEFMDIVFITMFQNFRQRCLFPIMDAWAGDLCTQAPSYGGMISLPCKKSMATGRQNQGQSGMQQSCWCISILLGTRTNLLWCRYCGLRPKSFGHAIRNNVKVCQHEP